MRTVSSQQVSAIALVTCMIVIVASMAACGKQDPATVLPSVNNTFVVVNGLRRAPANAVVTYLTEDLNLGDDGTSGFPVLVGGSMYTIKETDNGKTQLTKWHLDTGEKGWSVAVSPTPWPASLSSAIGGDPWPDDSLPSAYENLYYVGTTLTPHDSIVCITNSSGVLTWSQPLSMVAGAYYEIISAITPLVTPGQKASDNLVCAVVVERAASGDNSGIWIWHSNGILDHRISYPMTNPIDPICIPVLYDGATIYAALPVSSPHDKSILKTEYGNTYTDLVAISTATWRVKVLYSFPGLVHQLVKQGDALVLLRERWSTNVDTASPAIDVVSLDAAAGQHAVTSFEDGTPWTSIAVDSTRIYAAATGSSLSSFGNTSETSADGTLTAFSLAALKKDWTVQFAPYKSTIMDGPGVGEPVDYYPKMVLAATKDVLYVQDGGGLVVGIDSATGRRLWEKRMSQVDWHQTYTLNQFLLQPVDLGFRVIQSDGTISIWQ
ncbi:MAG: PQQ-binding-like beta-propeller repeat protein [Candidatus Cryosericum sp.]